ncbi:MAG: methyltransferase domain-containing protein [Phycisphaerales bacterium]|nr:methyltransferase domain-containing protein [Phycisphaerales bacterium]
MLKFVHQALRDIRTTGSVFPSSPRLALAMTSSLREHRGEKRILEVGPGTGAFTEAILSSLRGHDTFDVVEVNPVFCEHLEERLLKPFRARHSSMSIKLHCGPIEAAALESGYDFVICGLPFNNFPLALTESIFARMLQLMRNGGELTYFEYAGIRELKRPFVGAHGRAHIAKFMAFAKKTAAAHTVTRKLVVANVPPALAVRLIKRHGVLETCSASMKTS